MIQKIKVDVSKESLINVNNFCMIYGTEYNCEDNTITLMEIEYV
jgi:hypothetical protein